MGSNARSGPTTARIATGNNCSVVERLLLLLLLLQIRLSHGGHDSCETFDPLRRTAVVAANSGMMNSTQCSQLQHQIKSHEACMGLRKRASPRTIVFSISGGIKPLVLPEIDAVNVGVCSSTCTQVPAPLTSTHTPQTPKTESSQQALLDLNHYYLFFSSIDRYYLSTG